MDSLYDYYFIQLRSIAVSRILRNLSTNVRILPTIDILEKVIDA